MKFYHGTPLSGPRQSAACFFPGRHALVPFLGQDDLGVALECAQSVIFDNSAFKAWKKGVKVDFVAYQAWVEHYARHPAFEFCFIPDIIDGSVEENDEWLERWPSHLPGVPVYHIHEPLERLERLVNTYRIVALGSSGQWANPGSRAWWGRMGEVMAAACDEQGRPIAKLHGLRMMNPDIFRHIPLASADSVNAAFNAGMTNDKRWGMYRPPTSGQRAEVIADRIEQHTSAPLWDPSCLQRLA